MFNSPTNFTDPFGLCSDPSGISGGADCSEPGVFSENDYEEEPGILEGIWDGVAGVGHDIYLMGSDPWATAGGFVEGAGHGSMMVADAFTLHQNDALHAEVTELIDTHGGAYGVAYGAAHVGAAATYAAGGVAVGGAVAGAGGVGAIAPPLALVGGGTTGGAAITVSAGGVIGGGVVVVGGGAAAGVTAEYILWMESTGDWGSAGLTEEQQAQAARMARELEEQRAMLEEARWLQNEAVLRGDYGAADDIGRMIQKQEALIAQLREALRRFLEQIGL